MPGGRIGCPCMPCRREARRAMNKRLKHLGRPMLPTIEKGVVVSGCTCPNCEKCRIRKHWYEKCRLRIRDRRRPKPIEVLIEEAELDRKALAWLQERNPTQ